MKYNNEDVMKIICNNNKMKIWSIWGEIWKWI